MSTPSSTSATPDGRQEFRDEYDTRVASGGVKEGPGDSLWKPTCHPKYIRARFARWDDATVARASLLY